MDWKVVKKMSNWLVPGSNCERQPLKGTVGAGAGCPACRREEAAKKPFRFFFSGVDLRKGTR